MKYFILFTFLFTTTLVSAQVKSVSKTLQAADSLFAIKQYKEAGQIYSHYLEKAKKNNPELLLKMAYIADQQGSYTQNLYFLSLLAHVRPSIRLYEEMEQRAADHQLIGYEFNDFGYFSILYKRFGFLIQFILLIPAFYVLIVLVVKARKNERIQQRHKWIMVFYLFALLFIVSVPEWYSMGIVKKEDTNIRSYPSSAAPVISRVKSGNKLIVLDSHDNWYRVIWERKLVYIRKNDLIITPS